MKTLSCGIIIKNEFNDILIGHATGCSHWDLPKGTIEEGETPRECAVREAKEEFGLSIDRDELIDLGRFQYNSAKDLHLFLWSVSKDSIDIDSCACSSTFEMRGEIVPEIDSYTWINIVNIDEYMAKSMQKVLINYFGI